MNNPSVREISTGILHRVSRNGAYADDLIAKSLRKWNLKQEDKSLLLELVQGTLRWRGQLDWILSKYFKGDFKESPGKLKSILQLSLYQLRFLEKIPNYAAVSEGVEIAKKQGGQKWGRLVNGLLRNYLRNEKTLNLPSFESDPVTALSVNYSHPRWMVERWLQRYGLENTIRLCQFNNRRPQVTLRVNLLKTSTDQVLVELKNSGIQTERSEYFEDFIKISKAADLTQISIFNQGYFAIQDESTAIAALLLAPEKGDVVLDMCAAPGGKACYLAQLMGDSGRVIAVDRDSSRINRLQENTRRLSLKSIYPIVADSSQIKLKQVDKILIDAPCSGLGVLARRADLRWKRKPGDIFNIKKIQQKLLENASELLEKGGIIVYSTCTIEPEENEEVVQEFLTAHKDFRIEDTKALTQFLSCEGYYQSLPFKHGVDGTFAVKLIKV